MPLAPLVPTPYSLSGVRRQFQTGAIVNLNKLPALVKLPVLPTQLLPSNPRCLSFTPAHKLNSPSSALPHLPNLKQLPIPPLCKVLVTPPVALGVSNPSAAAIGEQTPAPVAQGLLDAGVAMSELNR